MISALDLKATEGKLPKGAQSNLGIYGLVAGICSAIVGLQTLFCDKRCLYGEGVQKKEGLSVLGVEDAKTMKKMPQGTV